MKFVAALLAFVAAQEDEEPIIPVRDIANGQYCRNEYDSCVAKSCCGTATTTDVAYAIQGPVSMCWTTPTHENDNKVTVTNATLAVDYTDGDLNVSAAEQTDMTFICYAKYLTATVGAVMTAAACLN